MKKIASIIITLLVILNTSSAQKTYVNINAGYGMPAGSGGMYMYSFQSNATTYSTLFYSKNLSLGKGVNSAINLGYMFNKTFGVELGLSYLMGGTTTASITNTLNNNFSQQKISATMYRIVPSFIFVTPTTKYVKAYAKFGAIIGMASVKQDYSSTTPSSQSAAAYSSEQSAKYEGGTALGINSAIGAIYKLGKKLSLSFELSNINLSYAPTKYTITKYNVNGVDELATLKTNRIKTNFVESGSYDFNTKNVDMPSQSPKTYMPMSSLGINIGLQIAL